MSPREAGQLVYDCMLRYVEACSNPVLDVLPGDKKVVENTHYPEPWFDFGNGPLRAYYHCHPQPTRLDNEHGHFHLFIAAGQDLWSHLGALSMDYQGQLQAVFSTNRWVTDEYWQDAGAMQVMAFPDLSLSALSLSETWLYAVSQLLRSRLHELWERRDAYLQKHMKAEKEGGILDDRDHYVLSQLPVDLVSELNTALSS